jgi:histidyl-tRNA synthetase
VIYEVVTEGSAGKQADAADAEKLKSKKKSKGKPSKDDDRSDDLTLGVGSVAAGDRYHNLVGMFLLKAQVPYVKISFGVNLTFSVLRHVWSASKRLLRRAAVRSMPTLRISLVRVSLAC